MNQPHKKPVIAFLGIGLMGAPMAIRLHEAGYRLRVWNRTMAKTAPLQAIGIDTVDSLQRAVASADIVITMLENGAIVKQVMAEVALFVAPESLVIDMSSTSQSEALDVHQLLGNARIACLDAPVSGGMLGAAAGTLAIMVGGADAAFARAAEVFAVLGRATRVGGAGTGQVAKLCNQLIVGGTLNIVAEALLLAQAAGADPVAVRQALRGGFAESRILEVHGQRMLERNFMPGSG